MRFAPSYWPNDCDPLLATLSAALTSRSRCCNDVTAGKTTDGAAAAAAAAALIAAASQSLMGEDSWPGDAVSATLLLQLTSLL